MNVHIEKFSNEIKKLGFKKLRNLPNEDYHSGIGFGSSNVKLIVKDVDRYRYQKSFEQTSEALKFGSMFDDFIFENHGFEKKYAVSQKFDKRTKQGKADFAEFEKLNVGKEIINEVDFEQVKDMRSALLNNSIACDLLNDGIFQDSFYYHDKQLDQIFKVRPDLYTEDGQLWDLKTCKDITDRGIKQAIWNYRYDISLGMYTHVMNNCGVNITSAGWIFVSKSKPYQVRLVRMPEKSFNSSISLATQWMTDAMEILDLNMDTYSDLIEDFDWGLKWD